MITLRKTLVVVVVLAVFGAVRLVPEQRFTQSLRDSGLQAPPIDIDLREKIGQNSAVVALGGLRTLVAALWNLRAYGFFERTDWFRVEECYETITTLAPRTTYYWDTGAWHIAYNASADYKEEKGVPPLRRRQKELGAIERGIAMFEQGIRNNPDSWHLPTRLAYLYTDRWKILDFPKAADNFKLAVENGAPGYVHRAYLSAITRIPGREDETLALARELHAVDKNRVPTLNCIRFVAESRANPDRPIEERINECFESEEEALRQLELHHQRVHEQFPQTGIREALRWLRERVKAPQPPPGGGR